MKKINKEEFLRKLADRSNFTIGDIKIIWECIEDMFADAIRNRIELNFRGFGKLYFTKVKSRRGYNANANEYQDFPETDRVSFKLAENFKNLLK